MLKRYRFKTKSIEDYRPLVDMKDIQMPWWCSSESDDYAIIICYLPEEEKLEKYWNDAYDIEITEEEKILYTSRFPKPKWIE